MHHMDFSRLVESRIGTYVDVEAQNESRIYDPWDRFSGTPVACLWTLSWWVSIHPIANSFMVRHSELELSPKTKSPNLSPRDLFLCRVTGES